MFKPLADKLTSATTSAKAGAKALGEKAAAVKEQLADKFKEHPSADGTLMVGDTRSFKTTLCGYDFEGCSIAGQETCIVVPRCKVAFDIGRCPQRSVPMQTVLFSHGHLDHIGGIHFHAASRALGGMPPPKYILPPHLEAPAKQLLEASWAVAGSPDIPYEILPLSPGQEYVLPSGFIARPFTTCHRVPSQGYILYSQRKKLRAELQGKSQEEIREVRASGEEVTTTFEVPEIAFTGDTSVELLEAAGTEDLFKARVLIMELTFLDDQVPMDTARERGHMHLADFVTHAHKFQNEAILLIHMSSRYRRNDILDILNTGLPPALRAKCVPFLNGFD